MASPEAGAYYIISAKNSSSSPFAMDVSGGSMESGANVQIYTPNGTAAQIFSISYRADGSARIVSRLTGKSLDIDSGIIENNRNVQMWGSNDSAAQRWYVNTTGGTATYRGSSYPTYSILAYTNQNYAMDVAGGTMAAGTNVQIHTNNSTDAQKWILVPVPAFASGGTYELRSMLKTSMAVDVSGGSGVKGANVQLYAANGTNAQKFYVTEEDDDEWSVMNVKSGMYLDVDSARAQAGSNVQQWTDNDSRAQRWRIDAYATTTVEGTTCTVVTLGSYVTDDGSTYMMDVYNALTTNKANIDIQTGTAAAKQRFALLPTTPKDSDVPTVASLGWSRSVGDRNRATTLPEATRLYPSWVTTGAWATDGPNHYEMRTRRQSMGASSGIWGDWSQWSEWESVAVTVDGTDVWATDGLDANVPSSARAIQYEAQVRAIAVDADDREWAGEVTAATLRSVQQASVTMSTMGFGPGGLRVTYSSDYDGGTNVIEVESVMVSGQEMLAEPVLLTGLASSGYIAIPIDGLAGWIDDGATATVTIRNGTDMLPLSDGTTSKTGTVSYDASGGLTVTPTLSEAPGRTIELSVGSSYDVTGAWVLCNGELTELDVTGGTATLCPPFGDDGYEFFVAAESSSAWGFAHVTPSQVSAALGTAWRPCHAWNWDGGSFLLEVRDGEYLETEYSVDRSVGKFSLNEREWESVHYARTKAGELTAEGALSRYADLESTREDLFALCDAGYATYRSPSGLMFEVAVTGFRITEGPMRSEVSVTMSRVSN